MEDGTLERWDARNQRIADRQRALLGGDDWVQRLDERTAGPRWAWGILWIPGVRIIGDIAIAVDAWRRHKRRRREGPS